MKISHIIKYKHRLPWLDVPMVGDVLEFEDKKFVVKWSEGHEYNRSDSTVRPVIAVGPLYE